MILKKCTIEDSGLLAKLNKELYEDERNDNIPSVEILKQRLESAITKNYEGYFFMEQDEVAGYALVKIDVNPYYLTHFFICKNMRRNKLGTVAFNELLKELNTDSIDLDVFWWNERGQGFWKSLGFKERCIIMRKS